ncbi:MAG TPA: NADPH:quinone reductase, partial [Acidimicrobiaceae bacterium]|nr:NADPH:quinone reductase [Acidimicrobiaceae bacterium]
MANKRVVVIGGGPAGHDAATYAARFGAEVTLIERDIVGGAAHLRDCVPSKSMIATGGALSFARRLDGMGLANVETGVEAEHLRARIQGIEQRLEQSVTQLLTSQGVTIHRGTGRLLSPNEVCVDTPNGVVKLTADAIVLATGSRPR